MPYADIEDRREANRRYWRNKRRFDMIERRYGISKDEYLSLLDAQNDVCAICHGTTERTLHVDHCHNSGLVRGLLCSNCNTLLGLAQEDIAILARAIEYLSEEE